MESLTDLAELEPRVKHVLFWSDPNENQRIAAELFLKGMVESGWGKILTGTSLKGSFRFDQEKACRRKMAAGGMMATPDRG